MDYFDELAKEIKSAAYIEGDATHNGYFILAECARILRDRSVDANKMVQPAPAKQGEGPEHSALMSAYWKGIADKDIEDPNDVDAERAIADLLPLLLASRPQPEAAKVVPREMLHEIVNLWHAYGWMPHQMGEIVAKHMPGYTVKTVKE